MQNKDQFGYYTVGSYKTYSKVEAIELHSKTGVHPQWHFNDEVFSKFDWKVEPTQSLDELYKIRAQQIRDKYDYIVLFYSSGSDSQNILNTFLRNNIQLDEIAQFWALSGDKDYHSHFNSEIYNRAIPRTLEVLKTHPNICHRTIDMTDTIAKMYDDPNKKFDFIYDNNCMFSSNNLARSMIRDNVTAYKDIIASGKSLCFISGIDKPRLFTVDNKYCFRFQDMLDSSVCARIQHVNRQWEHDELFYWSPDLPQLLIKQSHIIMRYLNLAKMLPTVDQLYFTEDGQFKSFGSIIKEGKTYYLSNIGLQKLIYGIDDPHLVKPSSTFFSARDRWFFNSVNDLVGAKNYMNGINKLKEILPAYWLNGSFEKGIKGCLSEPYFLE